MVQNEKKEHYDFEESECSLSVKCIHKKIIIFFLNNDYSTDM